MERTVFFCMLAAILSGVGCTSSTLSSHEKAITENSAAVIVGGGCDGCELMFTGLPDSIGSISYTAGAGENAIPLVITGTVYKNDGKTPASDVLIYYWHTDETGVYANHAKPDERAKAHGYLRGWIKTDSTGHYTIHTIRPAPYANDVIPAHIHLSVKEPEISNPYYMDWYFDDDPLLIAHYKKYKAQNRGGSERLRILLTDSGQLAVHDIVLGLNIPNYPQSPAKQPDSGLHIGEDQPSFMPYHAFGPDKGSRACPVCRYGRFHGILLFTGSQTDWSDVKKWLVFLEAESRKRKELLKVYFVYGNEQDYSYVQRMRELEALGQELKLTQVALTFVPSFADETSEIKTSRINPDAENTFVFFRHRVIIDKYVNFSATPENFERVKQILDDTSGAYFGLREPEFD
jgi:protocatechuate 3,4-dioxygenase beta subunit